MLAGALTWLGSALFAIYGLADLPGRSAGSNAPGIASGLIVVMAFLGNVFTPMSGFMLDIGRFTPALRLRRPGALPAHRRAGCPSAGSDPLWLPVANVLAWTVIFSLLALWGVRRSRART